MTDKVKDKVKSTKKKAAATEAKQSVRALTKYVRISPYKVRRVANEVRGANAVVALQQLKQLPHKAAAVLYKVLHSAVANATQNHGLDRDSLTIASLMVNEGPFGKRSQPRARGRIFQIIKPTSHIEIILESNQEGVA